MLAAIDLGAESGRVVTGDLAGDRLDIAEVHRFANTPVRLAEGLEWNVLSLWAEIGAGLQRAASATTGSIRGIAVDSWGVDFALLGRDGTLLGNPTHYRDDRTLDMVDEALSYVDAAVLYQTTGLPLMRINSLFQLLSLARRNSPQLEIAERILMIPDLFTAWLSGRPVTEVSIASTTQCLDIRRRGWARDLLDELAIPSGIFGEIVPAGAVLGQLVPPLSSVASLAGASVVSTASHDTAAAAAAVPLAGPDTAWISSGTWSIMGFASPEPVLSDLAMRYGIGNEVGADGSYLVCRTMPGLWLVQECRREWAQQGMDRSYGALAQMASEAPPFVSFVDPEDDRFAAPGEMVGRIRAWCRATGQTEPDTPAAVLRCAFESLALQYRRAIDQLERASGRALRTISIVGGGSQNALLCQMTADALGRPCVAGPVEATAAGNLLIQAIALGLVGSLEEGRALVRRSFDITTYEPHGASRWDAPYRRFLELTDAHA